MTSTEHRALREDAMIGRDVRQALSELDSVEGDWCSVTVPINGELVVIAVSRKQVKEWTQSCTPC